MVDISNIVNLSFQLNLFDMARPVIADVISYLNIIPLKIHFSKEFVIVGNSNWGTSCLKT